MTSRMLRAGFWVALAVYVVCVGVITYLRVFDLLFLAAPPGLVLICMYAHYVWWGRPARRRTLGQCPECAYDLRGDLASGCPECGWNREERSNDE